MNKLLGYLILMMLLMISGKIVSAQEKFTPYDDFPGVLKSYKPAYSDDLPDWAKMLYQYPLNFDQLERSFEKYEASHPGEESVIIRFYKIWRRAVEPHVLADGSIELPPAGFDLQQFNISDAGNGLTSGKIPENNSQWNFVGPKETFWLNESGSPTAPSSCPWQVNVYSFDVSASDNNILYCGTETGYVNKTTNKGLTWQLVGQNYSFGGSVTAVAIHPANPNIVYVAAGNQVHRSSDGGVTWAPLLTAGNLFYADRLKIDPTNPQKLFAASSTGIYISTDGGITWSKKWSAASYDVEIHPTDNSQVFALTKNGSVFSVIQSTDGGQTFTAQANFPNNIPESSGGLLAMTPANPGMILAILLSSNNIPYLVKGTSTGTTWNWALLATGSSSSFPMNNGQGYFDLALEISPVNANIILVGTTTLYKSLNGGTTFTAVGGYSGSFSIHPDIQDIKMLANGESWVSTDGGMNLTTDNFGIQANYSPRVNGIIGSDFWGFDQGWNEDIAVGGRYHNGNTAIASFYQPKALRMGGAESPTGWVLQGKSRRVAFNDLGNGWILPQTAEGKPEGRFIFSKYPNMDEYGGRRGNLVHHPNYFGQLYLGEGNGFWHSTDMGVSWDLLYNFPARVKYLQISYSNPEVIYADINGAGLVKSSDGGITWVQKPSLTSPPYGTSNWKGKLFFVISPFNENVIYACLQNGTWSADLGKVFRSTDGGDTWEDWSGTISAYMKCLVIQPSTSGDDIVYLFTNATNGQTAKVFYRSPGMTDWVLFNNSYPAGMTVNAAYPFFRDGKLKAGGNSGVWESPMFDTTYTPIITPWVEKAQYDCAMDTVQFDDHSMLDHTGVSWHWSINPAPVWMQGSDIRNPKVVLGYPGTYNVSLTVIKNGQSYTKTFDGMVTAHSCPSIYDCDNPAELPKEMWSLLYVDSEEIHDPGLAVMSFDNDPSTIWHTRWVTGTDYYPHEIRVDLGQRYKVSRFTYLNRQDGENGRIKSYELYITEDTLDWGVAVSKGDFVNTSAPQTIVLDSVYSGRYFRLVALSEVNGGPWASAAEFSLTGCVNWPVGEENILNDNRLTAFPVPSEGFIEVSLPAGDRFGFQVFTSGGRLVQKGDVKENTGSFKLNLSDCKPGVYLVVITNETGERYRVKVILR